MSFIKVIDVLKVTLKRLKGGFVTPGPTVQWCESFAKYVNVIKSQYPDDTILSQLAKKLEPHAKCFLKTRRYSENDYDIFDSDRAEKADMRSDEVLALAFCSYFQGLVRKRVVEIFSLYLGLNMSDAFTRYEVHVSTFTRVRTV